MLWQLGLIIGGDLLSAALAEFLQLCPAQSALTSHALQMPFACHITLQHPHSLAADLAAGKLGQPTNAGCSTVQQLYLI